MSTKVAQPAETFRQLIHNADAQLAALQQEQQAIHARLVAIASERATLDAQAQARHTQVQQATLNAQTAQDDLSAQEAAARIAAGTHASQGSAEPLDALAEHATRLRDERNQLISRAQLQADQDLARRTDLGIEEAECHLRLQEVERELIGTARAKAEALRDWGLHEHREAVAELTRADATIAELEQQLQAARSAKQTVYQTRLEALQPWANHQADVRRMVPLADPITTTLEACIAYVDALLTHGRALPVNLNVRALAPYYQVFDELLRIPDREIFGYQTIRDTPIWLRERRGIMAATLEEYRTLKG